MSRFRVLQLLPQPGLFDQCKKYGIDESKRLELLDYETAFDDLMRGTTVMAMQYMERFDRWAQISYQIDWDATVRLLASTTKVINCAHDRRIKGEYQPFELEVLKQVRACCIDLGEIRGIILKQMQRLEKNGQRSQQRQAG